MRNAILVCLAGLAVAAGGCRNGGPLESPPAANAAEPAVVVTITEGPTVDAGGNVFFSEIRSQRILKFTPGAGLTTFRENSNAANGLVFDSQWRLIAAEGDARRVTRTDLETGEIEVLAADSPETPIARPNDVTVDSKGRIYFTDYAGNRVYRIDPDGGVHRILGPDEVDVPNGIVISPDDRTLYHVEANQKEGGSRCIKAYDLAADGTVSNARVFHDFYPGRSADGLAVDSAGNLYAAAGLNRPRGTSETLDTKAGVHVFSPAGEKIAFYPIWEDLVTNLAFGGDDLRTLYVTAGKTLFRIRVATPGTRR